MAFDLLTEVKRLEKQLKEVLAGIAVASKGKPMPPQVSRLCGMSQTLAEVRSGIETAGDPTSASPEIRNDEGSWGKAFEAPPPPPPDRDSGPEDVAEAWVYDETPSRKSSRRPASTSPPVKREAAPDEEMIGPPMSPPKAASEEAWEDLDDLDGA